MDQENNLRLTITDEMINNIYRDGFTLETYQSGWWNHEFFNHPSFNGKFVGYHDKTYIDFPDIDAKLLFLLKFGAK